MTDHDTSRSRMAQIGRARLRERYRDETVADAVAGLPWTDALDVMVAHRTVRTYLDRLLAPGTLELIVAAAQSSPTTSNLQAWSVVAVEDKDRKARLARLAGDQRHIHDAPLLLLFVADLARLRAISVRQGHPGEALGYVEAFIFAVADAAFAAQNAVVAIESLGLGCCYIGAIRNDPQAVADEIGLPPEAMVVFGMTVGHPDPTVAVDVKPRLPQAAVLHRERYRAADAALIADYDEAMEAFRAGQDMQPIAWTEQAARRVRDEAAMHGRHVIAEFLNRQSLLLK